MDSSRRRMSGPVINSGSFSKQKSPVVNEPTMTKDTMVSNSYYLFCPFSPVLVCVCACMPLLFSSSLVFFSWMFQMLFWLDFMINCCFIYAFHLKSVCDWWMLYRFNEWYLSPPPPKNTKSSLYPVSLIKLLHKFQNC